MADNDVHLDYGGDQEPIDMSDARKRVERTVVARQGQPRFRNELLRTYGNRCAVTRCSTAVLLDAAHLLPYRGPQTNRTDNGILLRTDLHTLFDSHLMTFMYRNEDQLVALFSPGVDASLSVLAWLSCAPPPDNSCRPHPDALEQHRQACPWLQKRVEDLTLELHRGQRSAPTPIGVRALHQTAQPGGPSASSHGAVVVRLTANGLA
ncbi:HNH endonuclease [Dermacoccus abyssi]|uniref:HNH endonuclease n=1 Tax=Dermacoccus abyssi TaxID=322596 RepID=A0ABX5ZBB3_9MICO|nr:HNH endonuclease [Dermacoccus abyssi]